MKFFINNIKRISNRTQLLILALVLGSTALQAQYTNEVVVHLNGPISVLDYDTVDDSAALDNGIGFGLEYGRYLSDKWSLRTGVALQYYVGNAKLTRINGAYMTQDSEGENFEFNYQFDSYKERQKASYVQIPLTLQYEGSGSGTTRFFAKGGVKVGILVSSDYESEADLLTTAGYYEQYNVVLEAPKFAGFGNFGKYNWEGDDLALKTNVMLSLETGLKLAVSPASSFYLSVYVDYGLVNIFDETSANRLLEYNAESEVYFTGNSILTTPKASLDAIKTISFGFKLQYGLGF